MKQVINGKTYNTETAIEIGSDKAGLGWGDFRNYEETLYKTQKGRFFLAGKGGPMTRWAEPCGNMTSGGSGIQAISKQEALDWCENHSVDVDTITKHFEIEEA